MFKVIRGSALPAKMFRRIKGRQQDEFQKTAKMHACREVSTMSRRLLRRTAIGFGIFTLLASGFLAGTGDALAATVTSTWQGGNGNYSNPAKWSPANVPCNVDPVTFDVVIPDSANTVTMDVAACTVDSIYVGDGDRFTVPSGTTYTVLVQADIAGLVDDTGGTFDAPTAAFPGDRARAWASGGGTASIGAISYSSAARTTTGTLFSATGSGSLLDLSSLTTFDASFNDSSSVVSRHHVNASSGGLIDLGGLTNFVPPARKEDRVEFDLTSGGSVVLSSLVTIPGTGGETLFDVHAGSTLALPSVQTIENTHLFTDGGGQILINGASPAT
jgi:hypothetical protein